MQVTVETTQGLERRMRVEIPEEQIRDEVDKRLKDLARNARIPGFRPGKVPFKVVARRFGQRVRDEVVGGVVRDSLVDALDREALRPAVTPRIDPLESEAGSGVSYTATFDVLPDVPLPEFDSLEVVRPVAEVADEDVDRMLQNLRTQRRTWETVDRAATGTDRVVIDLEGIVDGEVADEAGAKELAVELDAGRMIDGFEEALVGVRAGDDRSVDLTFPEGYPNRLAGKPVTFNVNVLRVEEPELPELDDALAESFGIEEGGVEGLRNEARANMERELADGLSKTLKRRVIDALLGANEIALPTSMVRQEVDRAMERRRAELERSGIDPNDIELEPQLFEEPVRRRISLELLGEKIVSEHAIELDQSRVRSRVETIASTYQDPGRVVEWYYGERGRLAPIESAVIEDQIVEWVLDRARVTDEHTSFDRIMNPGQTNDATA